MTKSQKEHRNDTGLGAAETSYGPNGLGPSATSLDTKSPMSLGRKRKPVSRSVSVVLKFFDFDNGSNLTISETGVSREQGQKSLNDTELEWAEYIRNDDDIGIITLARYHNSENCFWKYYVKAMLIGTIFAQWTITAVIACKEAMVYKMHAMGFCANNAPLMTRVQSIAVSVVYISKMSFLVSKKVKDLHDSPVLNETEKGGEIQIFVALDRFMNLSFEVLVYLLNLFLIYVTLDPIDIVFNALAIEFVVQLDNEIKATYMELYPPEKSREVINEFKNANNDEGTDPITRWQFYLVKWINNLNLLSIPIFMTGFFVMFVLSLLCKPGKELFD